MLGRRRWQPDSFENETLKNGSSHYTRFIKPFSVRIYRIMILGIHGNLKFKDKDVVGRAQQGVAPEQ